MRYLKGLNFFRRLGMAVVFALILGMAGVTSADVIGDCSLYGYAYMAGRGKYATPDNVQMGYVIAQPLTYDYAGTDMWGYAWLKFENLSETEVESAYLTLDLLGVGGMVMEDASEEYPGELELFSPGEDYDVADLGTDEVMRLLLRNQLLNQDPLITYTMTANGTYSIDITDIYNGWVNGTITNNGLVMSSYSENIQAEAGTAGAVGLKFAGFESANGSLGNAPYISNTSAVPVPGAVWLLGSGLLGIIGLRRRK